ncbi:MAG: histidine phosphatase family protein [Chloroflexi bacterium]|nr:histidine phosphatase family protein [Chloroflexota bacterium]
MPVLRLLLIRHGQTDGNAAGRTQGRREVDLNDRGRAQALALAERVRPLQPAALYASPASRAQQTAAAIAAACGVPIVTDDRLAEVDHGELDGLTGEEMRVRHPDFLRRWRDEDPTTLRIPGGESMDEAQQRMRLAIAAIRDAAQRVGAPSGAPTRDGLAVRNQVVVAVVSHNLALHALLCHALGVPLRAFRQFRVDLASLSIVELRDDDRWAVVQLNEQCHLPVD